MRRFIKNDAECRLEADADDGFEVEVVDAAEYDKLLGLQVPSSDMFKLVRVEAVEVCQNAVGSPAAPAWELRLKVVSWAVDETGEHYWLLELEGAAPDDWRVQKHVQDAMKLQGFRTVVRSWR